MKCRFLLLFLVAFMVFLLVTSCFSLLKADRMVYAGSIGKKVDAVLVDSIQKVDVNSEK